MCVTQEWPLQKKKAHSQPCKKFPFDVEMEGDFAECLRIGMQQRDNRTICMTQKGLIKKIIMTAKMKECNPNKTPALTAALGLDAKGKPWDQKHWDCASVVKQHKTKCHLHGESSGPTHCMS